MKKLSLKGIVILGAILVLQCGCNLSPDKKAEYSKAKRLENSAYAMQVKGIADSAISTYKNSLAIYKSLVKTVDSTKDTLYGHEIADINESLGFLYDSLGTPEKAIPYLLESIKWAKLSRTGNIWTVSASILGDTYLLCADKQKNVEENRRLAMKALEYYTRACRVSDSIGWASDYPEAALAMFEQTRNLSKKLWDSSHYEYYTKRCEELKATMQQPINQQP